MKNKGFTLIEMVVYMALFLIIIGGLFVTTYQLSKSGESTSKKILIEKEINFVFKKIDWALSGASGIFIPEVTILQIARQNEISVFKFNSDNNSVLMCRAQCNNEENFFTLTTSNVKVESLYFDFLPGQQNFKEGVNTTLNIDGIIIKNTKYLR